jgi:hypothetical protein
MDFEPGAVANVGAESAVLRFFNFLFRLFLRTELLDMFLHLLMLAVQILEQTIEATSFLFLTFGLRGALRRGSLSIAEAQFAEL